MFPYPQLFNSWMQEIAALTSPKAKAFVVGGFVRDWLLGKTKTDIDIAVSQNALGVAAAFAKRIKGVYVLLDEDHGCARVVKKIKGIPFTIDFSDFRAPSWKGDLGLRDFSINSLSVPIHRRLTLETFPSGIVDFKQALKDVKAKTIRMNAPRIFADDPLRLLRAMSLSAQLGFSVEAKTMAQLKKDKHLIAMPAAERVREELFKILQSNRAARTLKLMDKIGLLDIVIPQLMVMKGVEQGGYHHLDVFKHSMLVVAKFEEHAAVAMREAKVNDFLHQEIGGGHNRLGLLKLACLLHDIGKPETRKHDGTRFTFHSHEHVGAKITRYIAKQLCLTVKERYFLEDMVKLHLRPGYLSNRPTPTERMFYRFFRDAHGEAVSLALLAMADQSATQGPLSTAQKLEHHTDICQEILRRAFAPAQEKVPPQRLLTGHDLIKTLHLKPSPLFKDILSSVEEAKALGKITTKKEALAMASALARSHENHPPAK